MQQGTGPDNSDLYFSVDLQDNVSPTADQIEKRLKKLGATKAEIKMFLTAYDQASPKIKQAQDTLNKLPKNHMINVQTNADQAQKKLEGLRNIAKAPITITLKIKDDFDNYLNKFKQRASQIEFDLKNSLRNTPLFAGLLGATSTAYNFVSGPLSTATGLPFSSLGLGAAGAGAGGAMGAFMAKSFEANAQLEQQMAQLTQVLRTPSAASAAYQQVSQTSQQTPFNQGDVLSSYIQMAQAGTSPKHPAYGIKAAANLAAGAQVPIAQATGALQNASLGYFESFNNLTGRNIKQTDFTYGGKYSGQTYEKAVLSVLKAYQGASQAQMQTFKGLMTNIQDVIHQKVILPGGAQVFSAGKGLEQKAASTLQSPVFQLELSREVDKLQNGIIKVFQLVRQGKTYFSNSLEQPLKDITSNVVKFGAAFGKAFGSTTLTAVKYLAQAFTTLMAPISAVVSSVPQIGQLAGMLKALHMLGISTSTGAANFFGGISHLNPIQSLEGLKQAASLMAKIGLYYSVKTILDMKNANEQLNSSFQGMGKSSGDVLDKLKVKFDLLILKAGVLGTNVTQLEKWGAGVASTIGPTVGPKKLAQSAYSGGLDIAKLSSVVGMDMGPIFNQYLKALNITGSIDSGKLQPKGAMDSVNSQIYQSVQYLSKVLGVDLPTAAKYTSEALIMFAKDLQKAHMYGPTGSAVAASIYRELGKKGVITAHDVQAFGTSDPSQITSELLQGYYQPSVPQLKYALKHGVFNKSWQFLGPHPNAGKTNDIMDAIGPYQNIQRSDTQAQSQLTQRLGGADMSTLGIQLPRFANVLTQKGPYGLGDSLTVPGLGNIASMNAGQIGSLSNKQSSQALVATQTALDHYNTTLSNVNTSITKYNDQLSQLSIVNEEAAASVAKIQLAMNPLQVTIDHLGLQIQQFQTNAMNPLARAISEASQKMTNFEHNSILPVQRAQDVWNQTMVLTSNRLEDVSFSMQKAQFNMDKYNSGMLLGENVLTAQIEKMTIYNEKLQELSLLNMGLQADITRTQFHNGFTSTVQPLMGFDLQREIQLGQERQQLMQSQYDTTYGYKHWQLQRAARTRFQAQEMSFATRMAGTKAAASTISQGTVETMAIQIQQYQEQLHSRKLEEQMYALQLKEWPLQDQQYQLNLKMFNLQNGPLYKMTQQMQQDQNKMAAALLPATEAQTRVNLKTQIQQVGIDLKLLKFNETVGALQGTIAGLHQIQGKLSSNLDQNIKDGPKAVVNHLYQIARDTRGSRELLKGISTALGGSHGQGVPIGHRGGPPSHPGVFGTLKNIGENLLYPLNWITRIGDLVSNAFSTITKLPIGVIAGIPAALAAAGVTANVAAYGYNKGVGGHVMPKIADAFKTEDKGLIGGVRNFIGKAVGGWGESMVKEVQAGDLLRPLAFAVRKAAALATFSFTQMIGSFLPGGHIVSIPLGWRMAQGAETRSAAWYRDQGRFGLTRGAVGQMWGGIKHQGSEIVKAFEDKGLFRGILRIGTTLFDLPVRLATWPIRTIAPILKNLATEVVSKTVGQASTGVSAAKVGLERGTLTKPLFTAAVDSGIAGAGASGAPGSSRTTEQPIKVKLDTPPSDAAKASSGLFSDMPAADTMKAAADEQASTVTKLRGQLSNISQAAQSFGSSVKTYAQNIIRDEKGTFTFGRAVHEISGSAGIERDAALASKESGGIFKKVTSLFGDHVGLLGKIGLHFGAAVGIFDLLPAKWQKAITNFVDGAGGVIKRFGGWVGDIGKSITGFISDGVTKFINVIKGAFTGAIESFKGLIGTFGSWISRLPGVKTPSTVGRSAASIDAAASKADRAAITAVEDEAAKSSKFKNALTTFAEHGGKYIKYFGKVLKIAGIAGGVLSFVPAGIDLIQGHYAQAAGLGAQAASYFLPVVGGAQILNSISGALGLPQVSQNSNLGRFNWATQHPGQPIPNYNPSGGFGLNTGGNQGPPPGGRTIQIGPFTAVGNGPGQGFEFSTSKSSGVLISSTKQAYAIVKQFSALTLSEQQKFWKSSSSLQTDALQASLSGPNGLRTYFRDYQRLSKSGLSALLGNNDFTLTQIQKVYTDFYSLSKTQQGQFIDAYNSDQVTAQTALLSGPKGLQKFVGAYSQLMQHFHNANLGMASDAGSKMAMITDKGFVNIGKTTASWLTAISQTIQHWEKNNGVPMTMKQAQMSIQAGSGQGYYNVQGFQVSGGAISFGGANYAAGGLVEADKHKVGPGRMVTMVEEGHPEVVIPLAPHRRDRARNLLRQTASMIGGLKMAAGGYVDPIPGFTIGRTDQGVDASAAPGTPILALGDSRLAYTIPGWYAGQPLINYQLTSGPDAGKYWYVSEQIVPSSMTIGAQFKAGQAVAKFASSGTGIEIGWGATLAASGGHGTLAAATGGYSEGQVTAAGSNFLAFIQGLAHGKLIAGGPGGGMATVPPIKLPLPPNILKEMGAIGPKQYSILAHDSAVWKKKLDSMSAAGGVAGSYKGPLDHTFPLNSGLTISMAQAVMLARKAGFSPTLATLMGHVAESESTLRPGVVNSIGATGLWQILNHPDLVAKYGSMLNPWHNAEAAFSLSGGSSLAPWAASRSAWAQFAPPGYAGGLPRVPRDGYPAILHQGETVLSSGDSNIMAGHHHNRYHHLLQKVGETIHQAKKQSHKVDMPHKSFAFALHEVKHIGEEIRKAIKHHRPHSEIMKLMREQRDWLKEMYRLQRHSYVQSVFQEINNNTKEANRRLNDSIHDSIHHLGHIVGKELHHTGNPFGSAGNQVSVAAENLIAKLHNWHGHSLQTHLVDKQRDHFQIEQARHQLKTDEKKLKTDLKHHASSKTIDADKNAIKHDKHDVNKAHRMQEHQAHIIKRIENHFIKSEEKAGVSKKLIEWAIKHVGDKDNQGLFTDAQLWNIPSALINKAGHYRSPSSNETHPTVKALQKAAKEGAHHAKHHHHSAKHHHDHVKHHHNAHKSHWNTVNKHMATTTKYQDTHIKNDTEHIHALKNIDKHLCDVNNSINKLKPTVQNNITVEVSDTQAKKPQVRLKVPRNR